MLSKKVKKMSSEYNQFLGHAKFICLRYEDKGSLKTETGEQKRITKFTQQFNLKT